MLIMRHGCGCEITCLAVRQWRTAPGAQAQMHTPAVSAPPYPRDSRVGATKADTPTMKSPRTAPWLR
jgi:hypothetical protein